MKMRSKMVSTFFFTYRKGKNAINNGKHLLFHLSKCSDKLYGNIIYKMQTEISNYIQVPA